MFSCFIALRSPLSALRSAPSALRFFVAALLTSVVCGDDTAGDLNAKVDEIFAKWNRVDVPGCSVGIVRRGELVYCKGFGSANLEFRAPNSPQTVFEMASFSKALTSMCVALLMDEGKISPEDDLRKFIPEMHAFDPPIRVQDMLRCRSGLWDQVSIPILIGWENTPLQHPHTDADFFSLIAGQKTLPFQPGSQFAYSSGDYFLLGEIVKRVSGDSLAEFARKRIFQPLGMQRTYYEVDESRLVEQRAVGHYKRETDAWHQWRPAADWAGGGGLKSCVEDLVRWDQNFTRNSFPSGKYLDEFIRHGTLLGNRACLDVDANIKEANADVPQDWPPGQYRGLKRNQFTGGAWGFTVAMTQFPGEEVTIICLSNSDDIVAWAMTRRIADLMLGDKLQPLPARSSRRAADELPTVTVPDSELQAKVGVYRLKNSNIIWRISLEDGNLQLTDHLLKKYPLRAVGRNSFDPGGPRFYATTQFIFAPGTDDAPKSFTSQWDELENRGNLKFEAVELVQPTLDQLREYVGEYESEELAATYRFQVRDGQLWLRMDSRRWEQLEPIVRDQFIPHRREPSDGRVITFLRGKDGAVCELSAAYFRVNGVRFARR